MNEWLEVGDVLLLNKKYPWFGGFLLQHIAPGPKATHVIIISRIDKKGNTFFSHATEHFFEKKKSLESKSMYHSFPTSRKIQQKFVF